MIEEDRLTIFYNQLSALGSFYQLNLKFNSIQLEKEVSALEDSWVQYNQSKPHNRRRGLSLFSLNGETDGEIDLNSLSEHNAANGTSYDEMSFRVPTPYWSHFKSLSEPLAELTPFLGRSHLLRMDEGGFFPPHRDLGESFRLISMFNCYFDEFFLSLDGHSIPFQTNKLYFMDTRLQHHLFSMKDKALVLVLNVELCEGSVEYVYQRLKAQ